MKTVRLDTFETNSSSTHSVTIRNKSEVKERSPLIENGKLYPSRLHKYKVDIGDSEGSSLVLDTPLMKSIWMSTVIHNYADTYYYKENDNNDVTEQSCKEIAKKYVSIIINALNNIVPVLDVAHDEYDNFTCCDEYNGNNLSYILDDLFNLFDEKTFIKSIIEAIIFNDNVVIADEQIPN